MDEKKDEEKEKEEEDEYNSDFMVFAEDRKAYHYPVIYRKGRPF